MPSHFGAIGFPAEATDDLPRLLARASRRAETFRCSAGRYLRWASPSGAELWIHLDRSGELVSVQPHFVGASEVPVRVTGAVSHPADSALEGMFHAWADPVAAEGGEPEGAYPFLFAAPDARLHDGKARPFEVVAQVAAFPHEVVAFESTEAFEAGRGGEIGLAPESFIPSGLFLPPDQPDAAPEPMAVFAGRVRSRGEAVNDLTDAPFGWATVDTLGGSFDVVLDPELMDAPPAVGSILAGTFWLSGRLPGAVESAPPGLLARLFGR